MGVWCSNCYNQFFKKGHFERKVTSIVQDLDLDEFQKKILFKRYIRQVAIYEKRTKEFGITYNAFRTVVTVGSILLPAFLSIQNDDDYSTNIYWTTWGISIVITLCNGCIQLYSLDKNYITFSYIVEKLKTEGWKYFQCSGHYKFKTHRENFVNFCEMIEKLKMKQVSKEIEFISKQGGNDAKNVTGSLMNGDNHSDNHSNHWLSVPKTPKTPKTPNELNSVNASNIPSFADIANLKIVVDKLVNNTKDTSRNIVSSGTNIISDAANIVLDTNKTLESANNIANNTDNVPENETDSFNHSAV